MPLHAASLDILPPDVLELIANRVLADVCPFYDRWAVPALLCRRRRRLPVAASLLRLQGKAGALTKRRRGTGTYHRDEAASIHVGGHLSC